MAKVLSVIVSPLSLIDKKLGKAVTSIALIVAGALTGNPALIAAGLASGASLFQKKPAVPQSQVDRLTASIDPRAFRKRVYGSTAMATDVRYQEWYGSNQEYCAWVVALSSHRITSVDEIWLNDELAWKSAGGAQGKYVGYFSVPDIILEGSAATIAVGASGKWNASRRLTGCAYAHFVFRTTGLSKKAESPFSSGIPSRVTVIGKGAPLYDPRRDSTVAGGSGPMRASDQGTWRYFTDDGGEIGESLPLQALGELLGWRINGRLALGCGLPAKRLNLASFAVAANLADELVNRAAGGTEPRYRGAGVLSEGDDPQTRLSSILAACNGRLRDTGGRLSLTLMHNDLAAAAADAGLTADDVMGPFTWNPDPSMETTPNVARGKYTDASPNALYQLLPYPDVTVPSATGIEVPLPFDLAMVESPSQAQRVVRQALQRRQYDRTFVAPFDIRAWQYPVGAIVPFTFPPLGFVRQLFRVAEQEIAPGGLCNMTLAFESSEIYRWDADDRAPVNPATAVVYDPARSALVQAIEDASLPTVADLVLLISNSVAQGLTFTAAADGTFTISAHQRTYADKVVGVSAGTVSTGAVPGDFVLIYYDDPTRAGGAVTYHALVVPGAVGPVDAAFPSPTNPGRHFLASRLIPSAGTSGGGTDAGSGGGGGGWGGRTGLEALY